MTVMHALYHIRPDLGDEAWDLCGIYSEHAKALEAMHKLMDNNAEVGLHEFAIDEIVVNEDLR